MSCRWRKILIRSFYIKIKWIKSRYWSYPTDLKDESYFCPKKNSTIKILVRDLWVKGCYLRHVHTISDGFSWRHEKPPGVVSTSIRYVTLYFRDRRGAASLRHINLAVLPIFCMNRSPIRNDFCGGAKAIQHSLNIALVIAEMDKIAHQKQADN